MTFNEQVLIEAIKGLTTISAVLLGGWYVSRALEKFKAEQMVTVEMRKRQYDALVHVYGALGKVERLLFEMDERSAGIRDYEAESARARGAISAASLLLGVDLTWACTRLLDLYHQHAAGIADGEMKPFHESSWEIWRQIDAWKEPLMAFLAPLRPQQELPEEWITDVEYGRRTPKTAQAPGPGPGA
ncbi:hypothetical protein [Anaeromyxobacter dehalogenans]|uniref:hypothetical protein n=1 Tax=Anaeromyxobacter dehalogenans TaxID=161493 RepID=UPI001237750E|nr:hypothetical protein [Anaeromyxobacter dehalogenans]